MIIIGRFSKKVIDLPDSNSLLLVTAANSPMTFDPSVSSGSPHSSLLAASSRALTISRKDVPSRRPSGSQSGAS